VVRIKTKKELQSERTISIIMNKSITLFARKGYYSTTLDNLANACGLTKGALYCHFKTKEELFISVFKEVEKLYVNPLREYIDGLTGDALHKIACIIKWNSLFAVKQRGVILFLVTISAEILDVHNNLQDVMNDLYDRIRTLIVKVIEEGKQEGTIRTDMDADLMAMLFIGAHDGILLQYSMRRGAIEGRDISRTLIKTFTKGFSK